MAFPLKDTPENYQSHLTRLQIKLNLPSASWVLLGRLDIGCQPPRMMLPGIPASLLILFSLLLGKRPAHQLILSHLWPELHSRLAACYLVPLLRLSLMVFFSYLHQELFRLPSCPIFITVRGLKISLSICLPFYTGFCAFGSVRQRRKDVFLLPDNRKILKISQIKSLKTYNINLIPHL